MHPARIFMGDSGSMLIGLVLAAGAISITGQIDPDAMNLFAGSEKEAVHQTVPVYIPLLLPLTIIAVPAADLVLAIVRRTWRGQSPFAADRGHLHHRLLEIGHSHSRAVLIMYFWSALIAFGALAYSVNSGAMWIVLGIMGLSAVGLVLLLLPRFTPRTPRWAEHLVPPRYRRRRAVDVSAEDTPAVAHAKGEEPHGETDDGGAPGEERRTPVSVGVSGANGATALGSRARLLDERGAGTSR
jgi:UDP-GlcNAc:undecaprenyl-phosphate GlcNAc-1-phosphate transferase